MGAQAEVTIVNTVRSQPPVVPVGPLSVCASLEHRGIRVGFEDYQGWKGPGLGDPDRFADWLAGSAPILGFSVFTSSLPLVLAAARRLKAARPDRRLVLGGPGTSGAEALLIDRFPEIDVVVHGEGEESMTELVEAIRSGRSPASVAGLSFREPGGVRTTPARPRNSEVGRLPPPAYHLADLAPYLDPRWIDRTPFGVILARGCAFDCRFCTIPGTWHGEVHARDVESVVEELGRLKDTHGVGSFRILDDTFTLDRHRALRFCERLAAARLDMPWLCHARVDLVDEELLGGLAGAGCRLVFYGLESGSDAVLRRLGKTFSVGRAFDVVEMSLGHMLVETSFMWGFPFESFDELLDTLVALLAVFDMGARTKLSWFIPFAGTALSREHAGLIGKTLRHDVFPARSHMDVYPYGPELMSIVSAHPDLFPSFYYLDYPGQADKIAYLKRWADGEEVDVPGRRDDRRPPAPESGPWDGQALPALAAGVSIRTIGGRRFAFDADRLRAFRISPFADAILGGCHGRAAADELVARLVTRHLRSHTEIRAAIGRVISRLEGEGLLAPAELADRPALSGWPARPVPAIPPPEGGPAPVDPGATRA